MSINFNTTIFPQYASDVVTDANYAAIDPDRRDGPNEQKVLTMIEVVRAMMAELATDEQARVFHYAMGRMLAGVAYNTVYDDLNVRVSGNDTGVILSAANGDTIDITDANGTDNVVLAAAPYAEIADLVVDINSQIAIAVDVEAYDNDGRLAFRNVAGSEGIGYSLAAGAGPTLLSKAGIEADDFVNPVEAVANAARDDAIAHFERSSNPTTL